MDRRQFLSMAAAAAAAHPPALLRVPAFNGNGESLKNAEWQASVDGKPAKVKRVASPDDDLLLLVVADLVGDLALVDPARQALAQQIKELPRNQWAGLLRAQDGLRVLADPAPDPALLLEQLTGLNVTGRAGLLDTVEEAARLASGVMGKSAARCALLYVTDSNIYNYREDYTNPVINYSDQRDLSRRFPEALIREKTAKLSESLAAQAAPLFVLHLAFLRDRLNEAYQNGLEQMAQTTGGEARFCRAVAEVPDLVAAAVARIRGMHMIDIEAAAPLPKTFTVALRAGDAALTHRTRYAAPRR